jgi:hypothetical protein
MSPVSIAGLVWFRVMFGLIMIWEVYRYISKDWISFMYVENPFRFKIYGFDWLPDIPYMYFYNLWVMLGILAFFVMIGLFYRVSIVLFTILFSYIFFIEQANYLNHFYFVCLMSFIMCFLDPHHAFSVDASFFRMKQSRVVPFWQHYILCFQMGIVYFFGGIAKIDPDWLTGVPLNIWLEKFQSLAYVGQFLRNDITAVFFSIAGLLLDLFIVPVLLMKRTRMYGFVCISMFHVMNAYLFHIGIFPWFSIATTLLYFGPDFPIRFLNWVGLVRLDLFKSIPETTSPHKRWVLTGLFLFCSYNILMPLRHHFYPGDVHWNDRGDLFSWRMKLRTKEGPPAIFTIRDLNTGKTWQEYPDNRIDYFQSKAFPERPEMIIKYVKYLKQSLAQEGHPNVSITVHALVSLNNRYTQLILKKDYDMVNAEDCVFCRPEWINELEAERTWSEAFENLKQRIAKGE